MRGRNAKPGRYVSKRDRLEGLRRYYWRRYVKTFDMTFASWRSTLRSAPASCGEPRAGRPKQHEPQGSRFGRRRWRGACEKSPVHEGLSRVALLIRHRGEIQVPAAATRRGIASPEHQSKQPIPPMPSMSTPRPVNLKKYVVAAPEVRTHDHRRGVCCASTAAERLSPIVTSPRPAPTVRPCCRRDRAPTRTCHSRRRPDPSRFRRRFVSAAPASRTCCRSGN
jgi:hypothetical protein